MRKLFQIPACLLFAPFLTPIVAQETTTTSRLASTIPTPTSTNDLKAPEKRDKIVYKHSNPQQFKIKVRASEIDSRVQSHPEIGYHLEIEGKPADFQNASVDTRVKPRGKLMIWLMTHRSTLFDRVNSYGIHAVQVHYANKWFSRCCREQPVDANCRGNIRLEAATGQDFSQEVSIPLPDGMMERSLQFLLWLDKHQPQGEWNYFLTDDKKHIRWEHVIMAGSSHGSTTASRFAKYKKVSRVVAFCGPRDQFQNWQKLPSATPENRYFGFSHVLDTGWTADHYCRSWELLGMHKYGPIVNVDNQPFPYGNTRRLITDFNVNQNPKIAHSSVVPGKSAYTKGKQFMHEDVWKYLFTHPVNRTGKPVPQDPACLKEQKQ